MSVLEWLKIPPARHSPSTLTETLAKVRFLKELGAHEWAFDSVPIEKQRAAFLMSSRRSACAAVDAAASNAISSAGSTAPQGSVFHCRDSFVRCTDAPSQSKSAVARLAL
jgi:hypothetical protein